MVRKHVYEVVKHLPAEELDKMLKQRKLLDDERNSGAN